MNESNLVVSQADFVRLMALRPPPDLFAELERAIVVPVESMPTSVVTMGSRVVYLDRETGQTREVEVVFPDEADAGAGKVSVFAPVGAALIGLGEQQQIEWDFPNGSLRKLTVVSVTQPVGESESETSAAAGEPVGEA
ncbi:MAG TPA: nucleoside diphosphate kinase regulator [Rhodocyclaceae bacterium]|nr:nucleoside diphosphate kinase regulator [Rhodocyclaceae bacterium]